MRRMVGPEEVAPLIALARAEQAGSGKMAAVNALVSACGEDAPSGELVLAELEQASDASLKDTWTRVLTATGYPKALPIILEGLGDDDPEVVAATITSFGADGRIQRPSKHSSPSWTAARARRSGAARCRR